MEMLKKDTTTIADKQLPLSPSKVDIVIGIDPDIAKSGVAVLNRHTKELTLDSLTFPELLDFLQWSKRKAEVTQNSICVLVEAGWLNTTHWHLNHNDTRASAAAKGNSVGRNHETGRKIVEMCQHWQIPHKAIKPLALKLGKSHLWNGKDGKITHEELASFAQLKQKRTNQEERDAALIAWNYAGLPIFIPQKSKK